MYRFYRMDKNAQDESTLNEVQVCAIQGDRVPSVPEEFHNALFYLGINDENKVFVRDEYSSDVPKDVISIVEDHINSIADKKSLPTYFHDTILFNGVMRLPHLHLVYIAESEEEVWNFVKG